MCVCACVCVCVCKCDISMADNVAERQFKNKLTHQKNGRDCLVL